MVPMSLCPLASFQGSAHFSEVHSGHQRRLNRFTRDHRTQQDHTLMTIRKKTGSWSRSSQIGGSELMRAHQCQIRLQMRTLLMRMTQCLYRNKHPVCLGCSAQCTGPLRVHHMRLGVQLTKLRDVRASLHHRIQVKCCRGVGYLSGSCLWWRYSAWLFLRFSFCAAAASMVHPRLS